MFGISPIGWIHTLGSLPAIPAAVYMLARHGRIVPRSTAGAIYLVTMVIGAASVFAVTRVPAGYAAGALTLLLLGIGYGVGRSPLRARPRAARAIETFCLSCTVFLLMLPTTSETLRRVPDGSPFVSDPASPVLRAVAIGLFGLLVAGLALQMIALWRRPAPLGD